MKQPVFEGLATAIVTPFRNGTIDIPTFEKLLDAQLAANVDAIVVCGTTGESATLSSSEQLTLTAHAMQYTAGRCKIIAGTGSNDTAHAIDLSRAASSMGVSAVLIVTPYYNKCTQTGLIAHYEAIADAISCPVICYNVPSRTGLDLKLETCQALAKHPNIQGVKEAGGSPAKIAKIIETCRRQFERHRNGSEMNASIAQYYAAHYKNDGCAPIEHQLRLAYTTPVATLHRFGALGACEPHGQAACPTTELDLRLGRTP